MKRKKELEREYYAVKNTYDKLFNATIEQ